MIIRAQGCFVGHNWKKELESPSLLLWISASCFSLSLQTGFVWLWGGVHSPPLPLPHSSFPLPAFPFSLSPSVLCFIFQIWRANLTGPTWIQCTCLVQSGVAREWFMECTLTQRSDLRDQHFSNFKKWSKLCMNHMPILLKCKFQLNFMGPVILHLTGPWVILLVCESHVAKLEMMGWANSQHNVAVVFLFKMQPFFRPLDVRFPLSWSQVYSGMLVLSEKTTYVLQIFFSHTLLTTNLIKVPNHYLFSSSLRREEWSEEEIQVTDGSLIHKVLINLKKFYEIFGL